MTPPLKYSLQMRGQVAATNALNKRLKKGQSQGEVNPLDSLHNWAEYAGEYAPVFQVQAQSKLHETTMSLITRTIGAANRTYLGPARMKYKTDFEQMHLLCDGKEVEPIHPGKIAQVLNVSNYIVQVTDASYAGFYSYPPDAISQSCKQTVLEIVSAKSSAKPVRVVLDRKTVEQIDSDFAGYRRRVETTRSTAPTTRPKPQVAPIAPTAVAVSTPADIPRTVSLPPVVHPSATPQVLATATSPLTTASTPNEPPSLAQPDSTVRLQQRSEVPPTASPEKVKNGLVAKLKGALSTKSAPPPAPAPVPPVPPQFALVDVTILSQPPGATIFVNGTGAGITPAVVKLQPGTYKVTLKASGHESYTQQITVEPGQVRSFGVALESSK
jgi:hypothetical protein